ncbi:MAG: hypothetical protein MJE68_10220 [Proteobacteria bacterium]|nr:hypothetical protein [Pseudomonadota bacterium]
MTNRNNVPDSKNGYDLGQFDPRHLKKVFNLEGVDPRPQNPPKPSPSGDKTPSQPSNATGKKK